MLKQMIVDNEKAAAAFANARTRSILFALMRADLSLVQLQAEVCMSLSLLHYHVARLKALGLLQVVETTRRAGRPVSRYRAVAEEFQVPAVVETRTPGSGLKQEMEAALERADVRCPSTISYFVDEQGAARMRRFGSENGAAHERWWRLRLSAGEARKLIREMGDLVAQYENAATKCGNSHLLHFALAETGGG